MTKQLALDLFETHRAEWLAMARAVAVKHAKEHGLVTADDVRARCPIPAGMDGRVMGAVFAKGFECVHYRKSTRAACHHRPIGVFRLAPPRQG